VPYQRSDRWQFLQTLALKLLAGDVLCVAAVPCAARSEVDRMDRQLQLFSATLESWLLVQRGWLKLEAVFAAPDIQRQVPAEAAAFAQVDKTFKDIMRRTHDRPNALQVKEHLQTVRPLMCMVLLRGLAYGHGSHGLGHSSVISAYMATSAMHW